jgi:hypothetical protein
MRRLLRILIHALVVLAVWFAWPYFESEQAQLLRQHKRILALASDGKWKTVTESIALEYEDQWNMNRIEAVKLAEDLLMGFIMLDIEWIDPEVTINGNIAKVRGMARIEGTGMGPSQAVKDQVNALKEPWVFTWRKDGPGSQGWKLLSLRNKGLGGPLPEHALKQH